MSLASNKAASAARVNGGDSAVQLGHTCSTLKLVTCLLEEHLVNWWHNQQEEEPKLHPSKFSTSDLGSSPTAPTNTPTKQKIDISMLFLLSMFFLHSLHQHLRLESGFENVADNTHQRFFS